ncbi:mariner Mos1 transposase [Trichonephila clavipes]|nr:mariner Mos1 transposase [Trichonephila clavipes]
MTLSLSHLQRCPEKECVFLSQIVPFDKTRCFHFEPESKRQNKQWKRATSSPPKKSKTVHTSYHTANEMKKILQQFPWETLEYLPYSPDLSPCDFHVFGPLKRGIHGHRFNMDDEVCGWVQA